MYINHQFVHQVFQIYKFIAHCLEFQAKKLTYKSNNLNSLTYPLQFSDLPNLKFRFAPAITYLWWILKQTFLSNKPPTTKAKVVYTVICKGHADVPKIVSKKFKIIHVSN